MKIGIIIAMESEYNRVSQLIGGNSEGELNGNYLILRHCGIGKVNAAIGAMELITEHHPDCIISTGVAGGIDSRLRVMDVVASAQLVYHDVWCGEGNDYGQIQGLPGRFEGDKTLVVSALDLNDELQGMPTIHAGLICTGDQFITNRQELDKIKSSFPEGLAVDMESCAIAHTCYKYDVPFVSFRIISDTPGATDDHCAQWNDFWATLGDTSFKVIHMYLNNLPNSL
ncbi:MAG: 5'-methylthioadenosine/S-adenosylhomocysteine nucleosidase [Bacteroidales bacterium]|nr:5'-methylthioadenosine/S-adenosylhomocysteine nucleosidase [Bacteroidales bacterium]